MVRQIVVLTITWCAVTCAGVAHSAPEVAFVSVDRALLRSGPGQEFFPTERVAWGTRLEVYHEIDQGWCAVRPVSESFSWVPEDAVRVSDDQPSLGHVVRNGVNVKVGSNVSPEKDVVSVTLKQDEQLQILGSETRQGDEPEKSERWYKIAPPSGEFRWIRRDLLQSTPPHRIHNSSRGDPTNLKQLPRIADESTEAAASQPATNNIPTSPSHASQVHPASRVDTASAAMELEDMESATRGEVQLTAGTDDSAESPKWHAVRADQTSGRSTGIEDPSYPSAVEETMTNASIPSPPNLPEGLLSNPTERSLDDQYAYDALQLMSAELEVMLRGSTRMWSFDELMTKTQEIVAGTDDPNLQAEGLELLGTLDRLEVIRQRHQGLLVASTSTGRGAIPGASAPARPTSPSGFGGIGSMMEFARNRLGPYRQTPSSPWSAERDRNRSNREGVPSDRRQYDGAGWLTSVISSQQGSPQYALTDADGRIVQLVEPQPGLNLRPYLRQEVGLVGRTSYAPALQKPVLTAERVTVLNRR